MIILNINYILNIVITLFLIGVLGFIFYYRKSLSFQSLTFYFQMRLYRLSHFIKLIFLVQIKLLFNFDIFYHYKINIY